MRKFVCQPAGHSVALRRARRVTLTRAPRLRHSLLACTSAVALLTLLSATPAGALCLGCAGRAGGTSATTNAASSAISSAQHTTWIALNEIAATGVPSQILGSIRADGGVYLINQNGIIFGGTSQINVNTLIAPSLNLTSQANFLKGSGILSDGTHPSFQSVDDSNRGYAAGAVMIQPGAQISAPNGKALLLGSTVANEGTIS